MSQATSGPEIILLRANLIAENNVTSFTCKMLQGWIWMCTFRTLSILWGRRTIILRKKVHINGIVTITRRRGVLVAILITFWSVFKT
jgi:hypothetical protein